MRRRLRLVLVLVPVVVSCEGSRVAPANTPVVTVAEPDAAIAPAPVASGDATDFVDDPNASYTTRAQRMFEHAEDLARRNRVDDALVMFAKVRRLFPALRYGTLASLRIADLDFASGNYARASDEYAAFAQDHRADERALAALRRAATARCLLSDAGGCRDDYSLDGGI